MGAFDSMSLLFQSAEKKLADMSLIQDTQNAPYGLREDGTPKGLGYFGELKRPGGGFSTELSAEADVDGKKLFFPLIVPTLTPDEINHLLSDKPPTDAIFQKAISHAQDRIKMNKNPFAGPGEQITR